MIVAFSTSSPWASVAAIDWDGEVLWQAQEHAPRNASAAIFRLLQGYDISVAEIFVADIGPGSFTGVRVGVILAKMFGYLYEKPVAGVDAFDLIDPKATVALPSKKGEYFLRIPGQPPVRTTMLPDVIGYGEAFAMPTPPSAARVDPKRLIPTTAELFVPEYLIPPSISLPKKAFARRES